ncbi:MAG: efflux RND transporter permease subunit [Solirubrobacteraceae bacterium]
MIAAVLRASLRFRLLVIGIAAGVMAVGIIQLRDAPVDVLPEFTPPYVEIQTEALGLSAEEVEQLVTVPLEADLLNGTKGVTALRSQSVPGASSIVLVFEPGTDTFDARQLVQEQLTQAHANPNVSQPPQMLQPLSSESRVMMIGLSPKTMSPIEASVLARWTIRPRLLGVEGVANVSIFGARDRQLQVLVDPQRLRENRVSLKQVIRTAGNAQLVSPLSFLEASTPGTGGFIDTANQRLQVRHILPSVTPDKLARVPLEGDAGATSGGRGTPRRLGDVTRVVEDHQPLIGDAVVDGGTGLLLVVEKFPGANTLEVTRGVERALRELRPGLTGLQIDSSTFRPADFIEEATHNLTLAVVTGCALALLLLLAFLYAWRTALVCAVSFALALTTAALVLSASGTTINALVFAGLAAAVGAVIGDAVIDVENIRRRLGERDQDGRAAVVAQAVGEMRGPMGYATAIVALTALPVFFIAGVSGSFLEPVVRAYLLAVAASMVVALTVTPALSLLLYSKLPRAGRESPLVRWTRARYDVALSRVIARPRAALIAAGAVLLAGLALIPALHGPVIPTFRDRDLLVHFDGPPGTSRPEMRRIVARASRELRALPGVSDVGGHVGRAVTGDQVVDVNSSELWVKVGRDADYDATKASVGRVVDGYPGLRHEVLTYERQRIRDVAAADDRQAGAASPASADLDVLTGADRRPLVVRVFGEDLTVLRRQAARMQRMLAGVDGVVDPTVERLVEEPTLAIEVDLARAQRYGIKPGDVRRTAATLLSGIQVGSLFRQQKVFEVVVRAAPEARRSLTDVRRLLIDTPGAGHVRLGQIADVRVRPTPQVVQRDSSSRRIDISADVRGRGLGDVQREVKARLAHVGFPLEYHAQVIGDATGRRASAMRLLGFALAAAIGIFLLLQAAFRSWRLAAVAFVALPLALVGGELAGLIAGRPFSLGSLIGLLAVLGIATRNGVGLFMHCRRLQERADGASGPGFVLRGARDRLAPIVIATSATAVALLPFAVLGDRAGYEIVGPMAVVMLGGLVTSTLLSLFLMPVLFARFGAGTPPSSETQFDLLYRWAGVGPAGAPAQQPATPHGNGAPAERPGQVSAGVDAEEGT